MEIPNQPVVIDNGSGSIKAGFAGEDKPRVIFPNYVGQPKYTRVLPSALLKESFVGKHNFFKALLQTFYLFRKWCSEISRIVGIAVSDGTRNYYQLVGHAANLGVHLRAQSVECEQFLSLDLQLSYSIWFSANRQIIQFCCPKRLWTRFQTAKKLWKYFLKLSTFQRSTFKCRRCWVYMQRVELLVLCWIRAMVWHIAFQSMMDLPLSQRESFY